MLVEERCLSCIQRPYSLLFHPSQVSCPHFCFDFNKTAFVLVTASITTALGDNRQHSVWVSDESSDSAASHPEALF